ncbi:unnamed protein product [Trichobilharzia regenti]|nr:unnamed protein product [Trichobilharzia regenti]
MDSEIQLNALKRRLESVQKSAQYQIESAKQSMKVKETELNLKIETLEKVNQISDEKWRNLLDKQQKVSLLYLLIPYLLQGYILTSAIKS